MLITPVLLARCKRNRRNVFAAVGGVDSSDRPTGFDDKEGKQETSNGYQGCGLAGMLVRLASGENARSEESPDKRYLPIPLTILVDHEVKQVVMQIFICTASDMKCIICWFQGEGNKKNERVS